MGRAGFVRRALQEACHAVSGVDQLVSRFALALRILLGENLWHCMSIGASANSEEPSQGIRLTLLLQANLRKGLTFARKLI